MTAGIYNSVIEQGADFAFTVFWRDDSGNIVNLTGCSAALMIRNAYDDPVPLVSVSSASGGIVIGGPAGTTAISIPAAITSLLSSGRVVYDLRVIDSTGKPIRLIQGYFNIAPSVTR